MNASSASAPASDFDGVSVGTLPLRADGVRPVVSISSAVPVLARELGKGRSGIEWVVSPDDEEALARLIALVNATGGYDFWKFVKASESDIARHA